MAIDNFQNRGSEVMIPPQKATQIAGFSVESIQYHLGGTFRGSYYTLNDNIINGRIRGWPAWWAATTPAPATTRPTSPSSRN
jgi:carbon-monoxide dehydrogenase catalytic subunit